MRTLFPLILFARLAHAETEESVLVLGDRLKEERVKSSRTGQSLIIQPNESSRFDASSQLRLESSLTFIETGRVSPSGFVIPKVRGQDSKLTDVYVEDILLSDPYSGLPLVEDLDLRAFGALEIHQGAAPVSVPSSNSVGILRYRFQDSEKSNGKIGFVSGSPYGHSIWGLGLLKREDQEFRLYARTHQSSGRYRFYSDQATPYNTADDKEKVRLNNDQRSHQVMPVYRANWGPYEARALAWIYQADRGIPSISPVLTSTARDLTEGHLLDLSLSRNWQNLWGTDSIRMTAHIGRSNDQRETKDPEKFVLSTSDEAKMNIEANRQGFNVQIDLGDMTARLSLEEAQSEVRQSYESRKALALDRSNETAILGIGYNPFDQLAIETKVSSHRQWDKLDSVRGVVLEDEKKHESRYRFSRNESLSIALGKDLGVYSQISRSHRLPSLYEEYGNGSTVRPNAGLQPEQLFHRELGGFYRSRYLKLSAGYYIDKTDDKIIVVPVLASASKALNVAETDISGFDGEISVAWENSQLSGKASLVAAKDKSQPNDKYLPGIPKRIFIGEWRQSWLPQFSTHINARYRSEVFRDLGNNVKLPGLTTYDGNIDFRHGMVEIGLSIRNLLDTKHIPIETDTSRGETGISDIAGSPLPGRQWILSIISNWE